MIKMFQYNLESENDMILLLCTQLTDGWTARVYKPYHIWPVALLFITTKMKHSIAIHSKIHQHYVNII